MAKKRRQDGREPKDRTVDKHIDYSDMEFPSIFEMTPYQRAAWTLGATLDAQGVLGQVGTDAVNELVWAQFDLNEEPQDQYFRDFNQGIKDAYTYMVSKQPTSRWKSEFSGQFPEKPAKRPEPPTGYDPSEFGLAWDPDTGQMMSKKDLDLKVQQRSKSIVGQKQLSSWQQWLNDYYKRHR